MSKKFPSVCKIRWSEGIFLDMFCCIMGDENREVSMPYKEGKSMKEKN